MLSRKLAGALPSGWIADNIPADTTLTVPAATRTEPKLATACRADRGQDAGENSSRVRRTTGHGDVDRNDVRDAPGARVALAEDAARAAAVADRDDELRIRRRVVGASSASSMLRDTGTGHEQQIGVPRTRDEPDAEPFDVVERVVERMDLELAAVARAGVDVANAQRAAQRRRESAPADARARAARRRPPAAAR